ncbi:MAG: ComEC/Rec2 family competence protein, partial [Dehalococcoidia bacterium]
RENDATAAGGTSLQPTPRTVGFLGALSLLGAAALFLWAQVLGGPDGKLHVYFLDVDQGDSTLIVTPGGRQVLIDGGPETESATGALSEPLAFWDRSLDLVALTHLDADHSRGLLEVLDRYDVSAVMVGIDDPESSLYPQWQAMLDRNGAQVIPVVRGQQIRLEEGVLLEVLHPSSTSFTGSASDANNNGIVLRLVYGEVSFLLTGDIEAEAERQLLSSSLELQSRVLKVGHHGSDTSTTPEFLRRVNPELAVISAGANNPYGHPDAGVVSRLVEALGEEALYQTALQGTVEVVTDGSTVEVRTER